MYWCFLLTVCTWDGVDGEVGQCIGVSLLRCVPGMALMGRSDSVLVFLAAVCTWDGVDGEVGQCIGVSCCGVYLGWR